LLKKENKAVCQGWNQKKTVKAKGGRAGGKNRGGVAWGRGRQKYESG